MNAPGFWTLQLSIKSGIRRIDGGNFAWKEVVETWKSMSRFHSWWFRETKKKPCVFCCKKHCIHPKIPFSQEFDLWKTEMKSYSLFLSLFLNYMLEYETATELCESPHWPKLECSTGWNPGALKRFHRHGFHWWSLRVPTRHIFLAWWIVSQHDPLARVKQVALEA